MESFLASYLSHAGIFFYFLVLGLYLLATVGFPFPEELNLFCCGYAVYHGFARPLQMILLCLLGSLLADTIIYAYGSFLGERFLRRLPLRPTGSGNTLTRIKEYFRRFGTWTIAVARFLTGVRYAAFFTAGISRMNLRKFLAADLVGGLIFTPSLIYLGYRLAPEFDRVSALLVKIRHLGWVAGIIFLSLAVLLFIIGRGSKTSPELGSPEKPAAT